MTANEAMDRYASGDSAAFAEVYDALADRLFRFLVRRTLDSALAEDLLQQTFLHMHCARETYVGGTDVVPWAFCIARRLSVDAHRRKERDTTREAPSELADERGGPEDDLVNKRALTRFQRALDELPEAQRVAFELTRYDGLTHAEVANLLGTTVTAIKLRVHRAYEHLRASAPDAGGPP